MVLGVIPPSNRTQGGSEGLVRPHCVDSRGPAGGHDPADSHLLCTRRTLGILSRKSLPWLVHTPLCIYRKKLRKFREENDGEMASLGVACALSSRRLPQQRRLPCSLRSTGSAWQVSKRASGEALPHQARVTSSTQQHTVCRAPRSPADPGGRASVRPQPAESPRPILQNKDDCDFSKYVHVPKALTWSERVVYASASLTKYPDTGHSVSFIRPNQTKKTLISRYSKGTFRYWEQAAASS